MRTHSVVVAIALLVLLASCSTTKPIWFIATPGYVESQLAAREEALRSDYTARIVELEIELESQRAVSEELASLAEVIKQVEASNLELQGLAGEVEKELAGLPSETIRIIVEVLSRHVEGPR